MEKRDYIRGWRQITALYYAFWCLFTGNWLGLKRELHIMTGFARPYGVRFAPSFWDSAKKNLGLSDERVQQWKEEVAREYGEDSISEKGVKMNKCGDHGMHWYHDGETCVCGQIPKEIFFAASCSCGAYRYLKPIHDPDCTQVEWGKKRNQWITEHPDTNPPLDRASYRVKQ